MIKIREAGKEDNERLLEIQRMCPQGTSVVFSFDRSPDFFNRSKSYEKTNTLVAEEDGLILGVGSCAFRETLVGGEPCQTMYEFGFLVDPNHRRKGVATLLQNEIESIATSEDADIMYLTTVEENIPSMKLFEKTGFELVRTLHRASVIASTKHDYMCNGEIRPMEKGDVEEVVNLMNSSYKGYELYSPFTEVSFMEHINRISFYGLSKISVLEEDGEIKATIGRWPMDKVMQTTLIKQPKELEDAFRAVAPNLVSRVYEPLKMDFGITLSYKDESSLNVMIKNAVNQCLGIDQIFFGIGLDQDDPARKVLANFPYIPGDMGLFVKSLKGKRYPTLKNRKWFFEAYEF